MLKRVRQAILRFFRGGLALGQAVAGAPKQWRQQQEMDAEEVERLDRIRNPSKYLGKS